MATKNQEVETVTTAPASDFASLLGEMNIQEFIQQQVEKAIAEQRINESSKVVHSETRAPSVVEPQRFLKHYRCDVAPEIQILKRTCDDGDERLGPVIPGEYIKFRRGHFFATDQQEVNQLEWMRSHPTHDPRDHNRVIGGNPTIYEDDGNTLIPCPDCGEQFVAGSNAYKAHRRATHGIME